MTKPQFVNLKMNSNSTINRQKGKRESQTIILHEEVISYVIT